MNGSLQNENKLVGTMSGSGTANGSLQNENKLVGTMSGSGSVNGRLGAVIGRDGKSAYEVALGNGFEGTEAEWLASLKGDDGNPGIDGKDGKDGNPGVYVGSGDMPEGYRIQINPEGSSDSFIDSIVAEVLSSLPIYNGEVIAE